VPATARGVIYIINRHVVTIMVRAQGRGAHSRRTSKAPARRGREDDRVAALWLLAIGFVGYALWRLARAVYTVYSGDRGTKARRPGSSALCGRCVYASSRSLTHFKIYMGREGGPGRAAEVTITASINAIPPAALRAHGEGNREAHHR